MKSKYIKLDNDVIINTDYIERILKETRLEKTYTLIYLTSGERMYTDEKYYFKLEQILKPLELLI